jgi:hypothetical protein
LLSGAGGAGGGSPETVAFSCRASAVALQTLWKTLGPIPSGLPRAIWWDHRKPTGACPTKCAFHGMRSEREPPDLRLNGRTRTMKKAVVRADKSDQSRA